MEFALSQDQKLMTESLAGGLKRAAPLDRVRKAAAAPDELPTDVWAALVDLGAAGVLIAEEHGGLGLGLLDAALISEALGYSIAPAPFVGACVIAPLALRAAGSPAQQGAYLPKIAAGELIIGAALSEHAGGARDGAAIIAANGRLSGKTLAVLDARGAHKFLIADATGALFLVDAGDCDIIAMPTIDRTRPIVELRLSNAPAEALTSGNPKAALREAIDAGRVALAADCLGAAQAMLDQAVAYAKERKQFGRVIASFQAVKHLCAEMAAELEPCRALLWYAAHAHGAAPDRFTAHAAHVKAHLSEVGTFVARTATEVHGGMGFTDLLGLHYWFKRIGFDRQMLGGPSRARADAAIAQGWIAA